MKSTYIFILALVLFSCGNERVLLLPEIENAAITEIHDVSHAYLFYDVTQTDSIELNGKNLISTTNWLINVDKRLSLAQAIPKIKLLQDKKRNAKMHKNEAAKNYYTCNDTSIQNLGFLEFTNVVYAIDKNKIPSKKNLKQFDETDRDLELVTNFHRGPDITLDIELCFESQNEIYSSKKILINNEIQKYLETHLKIGIANKLEISLVFNKNLSIQDYISIKSKLSKIKSDSISFSNTEFIY